MKHIEAQWARYRQMVVSPLAGEAQMRDMRDAFFAGAMTLFEALVNGVSEGPENEVTPSDMQMMNDLQTELDTWQAEVEARVAKVQ
jgi:hypothetical protein